MYTFILPFTVLILLPPSVRTAGTRSFPLPLSQLLIHLDRSLDAQSSYLFRTPHTVRDYPCTIPRQLVPLVLVVFVSAGLMHDWYVRTVCNKFVSFVDCAPHHPLFGRTNQVYAIAPGLRWHNLGVHNFVYALAHCHSVNGPDIGIQLAVLNLSQLQWSGIVTDASVGITITLL